jgi:hypothetical protein
VSVGEIVAIVGVVLTILSGVWAVAKWFDVKLDARFAAQEKAREAGVRLWAERMGGIEQRLGDTEKDVRQILIELPREYVRREDWVRSQTIIEGKLDALALRIENALLRGNRDA